MAANYQQTVLNAFREVEDNLAGLRMLGDQTQAQDEAVGSATRRAHPAVADPVPRRVGQPPQRHRRRPQRAAAAARRRRSLKAEQARATVNLIRAIGGGWNAPSVN
jgi:multidrug efflux system outer membrane protein